MSTNHGLSSAILDSLSEQIAVIDTGGQIVYVNAAWKRFAEMNGYRGTSSWESVNYLASCDAAERAGDAFGKAAAAGIRDVLYGRRSSFDFEYPCHSREEQRWFIMGVLPLRESPGKRFVLVHRNITQRKLLEERLRELSFIDELTGLDNRRQFERMLRQEWRRCKRSKAPLSLLLIDVDHFKEFNDAHGHPAGDACLVRVAQVLKQAARRPGDLAARYGGEEFALVLGDTDRQGAESVALRVLENVRALQINHAASTTAGVVTVSIGVNTVYPAGNVTLAGLVEATDKALYRAKESGRNRALTAMDTLALPEPSV